MQLLSNKAMISSGVALSSVAPNMMLSMDWDFFKNSLSITNPLKGGAIYDMTPEGFHESFANTLSEAEAEAAYEKSAVHDSRNVLRDCVLEAKVDLELPHGLVEKNTKAYEDSNSTADFKLFPARSHYICGEPGWQEVAEYVYNWLQRHEGETAYGRAARTERA